MKIEIPEITEVLDNIQDVESKAGLEENEAPKSIQSHRKEQKDYINENKELLDKQKDSELTVIKKLIVEFLMRAVKGERGNKLRKAVNKNLQTKEDLNRDTYKKIIAEGSYRFGEKIGVEIFEGVINTIHKHYNSNLKKYFSKAENNYITNFEDDPFLDVKNIGHKVRDLALSNFNENYIANDLHVVRVATRIGLLNYGYRFASDDNLELGNNASNKKQYRFLHKLFLYFSDETKGKYKLVDIDRSFWHLGKTLCNNKPKCKECPINNICLTGIQKLKQ